MFDAAVQAERNVPSMKTAVANPERLRCLCERLDGSFCEYLLEPVSKPNVSLEVNRGVEAENLPVNLAITN